MEAAGDPKAVLQDISKFDKSGLGHVVPEEKVVLPSAEGFSLEISASWTSSVLLTRQVRGFERSEATFTTGASQLITNRLLDVFVDVVFGRRCVFGR
ncbi:hypothetical protein X801_06315 [Opisthorchis viverrini]|uniref:Uncharacterized protein n=1 Tax=Opisthorchis viverrini TaxID=6198 RepID=A0A1S8WTK0_OPIVI|nr:hypothetical protein X801_06315 [Opisthorchis viverrini]